MTKEKLYAKKPMKMVKDAEGLVKGYLEKMEGSE